jgi:transcriptional regulator of arginine metabolism
VALCGFKDEEGDRVKKQARQEVIRKIIEEHAVETQEELTKLLEREGIMATQATVSRDIHELGLAKVRNEAGRNVYQIFTTHVSSNEEKLQDMLQEGAVKIDRVAFVIVIKTTIGTSNVIAALLDELDYEEALGTIAGADTLMITCRSVEDAEILEDRLIEFAR